ncbi:hypothetical protein [Burkholderia sp. Bp9031]|uniref:hypothetical protein n=1 Tax=Burkholderia sp. Bp9031 TaxID=2184566 RepID=UPI000F5DC6C7|nr:hypothetical protein [Burkholderia sp. Bp9031]
MADITSIADYRAARGDYGPPKPTGRAQKKRRPKRNAHPLPAPTATLTRTSKNTRELEITEDYVRSKLMFLEDLVATAGDVIHDLRKRYPYL